LGGGAGRHTADPCAPTACRRLGTEATAGALERQRLQAALEEGRDLLQRERVALRPQGALAPATVHLPLVVNPNPHPNPSSIPNKTLLPEPGPPSSRPVCFDVARFCDANLQESVSARLFCPTWPLTWPLIRVS